MINYRNFLKFFVLPVTAVSVGVITAQLNIINRDNNIHVVEKINPPVVLKGCVYNEKQPLPAQYNIIVGFYRNYEDIQNSSPVNRTIVTNNEKCYSIQLDPDFVTTPGFLVSYVVPPNVNETIPLEKGMIINDWYSSISFPENMYKNLFLSQKWDVNPEIVEEYTPSKGTLPPQEKKTLLWNSEQLMALSSSRESGDKEINDEILDPEIGDDKDTDSEIKKLLQQNGVDLSSGFTPEAKSVYHKLISEYFDYLYNENEKAANSDDNASLKQMSFKEFLADRTDKLNQKNKLTKTDLDLEKKLSSTPKPAISSTALAQTKAPERQVYNGGQPARLNKKEPPSNPIPTPAIKQQSIVKKESEKVIDSKGQKKLAEKELVPYTLNGDVIPPNGVKDLCSVYDKSTPVIAVDLFLSQTIKNYPSVPKDYTLHTEVPLASSFVDCKDKSFSLDFKLENEVGKESPITYLSAYVYDSLSPNHIDVLYTGTDENVNAIPPSFLSKRETNPPIEVKLKAISKVFETLFSLELFDYSTQNTIDDIYVKPTGLDLIPKLDSMVSIYRTVVSKSSGWARLQSLPFASLVTFELNDTRGADSYLPTSFKILSTAPDFTTSIPLLTQNSAKVGTSNVIISIPPYLKDGEVLLISPSSKNKASFVFNSSNKSNLLLAKDLSSFDKTLLDLHVGNKSMGLMPIYPKANKLIVVEPVPKTIKTIRGSISILKDLSKLPVPCSDCRINLLYTEKSSNTNKDGTFTITDVSIIDDLIEYEIESKGQKKVISSTLVSRSTNNLEIKVVIPDPSLTDSWSKLFPTSPSEGLFYGDFLSYKSYKAFLIAADKNTSKKATYFDDKTALPTDKTSATSSSTNAAGSDKFLFPGVFPGNYFLYIISDKILHIRPVRIEPDTITLIN